MKIEQYPICNKCFKKAEWQYAGDDWYVCDDCLPRSVCSCNYVLRDGIEQQCNENGMECNPIEDYDSLVDEKGRLVPCADWNRL